MAEAFPLDDESGAPVGSGGRRMSGYYDSGYDDDPYLPPAGSVYRAAPDPTDPLREGSREARFAKAQGREETLRTAAANRAAGRTKLQRRANQRQQHTNRVLTAIDKGRPVPDRVAPIRAEARRAFMATIVGAPVISALFGFRERRSTLRPGNYPGGELDDRNYRPGGRADQILSRMEDDIPPSPAPRTAPISPLERALLGTMQDLGVEIGGVKTGLTEVRDAVRDGAEDVKDELGKVTDAVKDGTEGVKDEVSKVKEAVDDLTDETTRAATATQETLGEMRDEQATQKAEADADRNDRDARERETIRTLGLATLVAAYAAERAHRHTAEESTEPPHSTTATAGNPAGTGTTAPPKAKPASTASSSQTSRVRIEPSTRTSQRGTEEEAYVVEDHPEDTAAPEPSAEAAAQAPAEPAAPAATEVEQPVVDQEAPVAPDFTLFAADPRAHRRLDSMITNVIPAEAEGAVLTEESVVANLTEAVGGAAPLAVARGFLARLTSDGLLERTDDGFRIAPGVTRAQIQEKYSK